LGLESLNEIDLEDCTVIKYFYSKLDPEKFLNSIDLKEWISERYSKKDHNCIHCLMNI
jgi:hypothetical protein